MTDPHIQITTSAIAYDKTQSMEKIVVDDVVVWSAETGATGSGLPDLSPSPAGTWGDGTHVPQFVTNAKGLITGVTNVAIAGGSGGLIPATPPAPFATMLNSAIQAGQVLLWFWGDVTVSAAIKIDVITNINGGGLNMFGSKLLVGFNDNTANLLEFSTPTTAPMNTNWRGLTIENVIFFGVGTSLRCKNCLALTAPGNNAGMYGITVMKCQFLGAFNAGLFAYGNVFEMDIAFCVASDNTFAGFEFRNPAAGGGIISSIRIWGGDIRTNGYGIAMTADISYQEPSGIKIFATEFIANRKSAVIGVALERIRDCHMENNCDGNTGAGGESSAAIIVFGGALHAHHCDAVSNNGKQLVFAAIGSPSQAQTSIIEKCVCYNENDYTSYPLAQLSGAGTLNLDADRSAADVTGGAGNWKLSIEAPRTVVNL